MRNFSAKIREILTLQQAHRTHTDEHDRLEQKARRNPFFEIGVPWETQLSNAEQALEHERIQQRYDRLQAWRNKMQSSIRSYYKWIKHTQYTFPFVVCSLLHRINSIPLTLYPMP